MRGDPLGLAPRCPDRGGSRARGSGRRRWRVVDVIETEPQGVNRLRVRRGVSPLGAGRVTHVGGVGGLAFLRAEPSRAGAKARTTPNLFVSLGVRADVVFRCGDLGRGPRRRPGSTRAGSARSREAETADQCQIHGFVLIPVSGPDVALVCEGDRTRIELTGVSDADAVSPTPCPARFAMSEQERAIERLRGRFRLLLSVKYGVWLCAAWGFGWGTGRPDWS